MIVDRLLQWFAKNKRSFPWRETFGNPDPYLILFTEIMLQRTRADQVSPIYLEFAGRYPTFQKLANATDNQIISIFSRLGLEWRARNVVALIKVLKNKYQGKVPTELKELRELPGVGDYVSKAVMCYAFGKRFVPLDVNVVRVISRIHGIHVKADLARRDKKINEIAMSLLSRRDPREFNLALLDFAALVCKPKPLCHSCPMNDSCEYARTSGVMMMKRIA